jgi:hypothetical protein
MARRNKVHSCHKDDWKRDILLLTCILRLRLQPVVPYSDIAELFLLTISTRLASLTYDNIALAMNTASNTTLPNVKPSNFDSLFSSFSTASSNTESSKATLSNPMLANTISAHTILANSISTKMQPPCDDNSEKWMKDWLVQYLENDFKGAEFRGDQTWWKARDMDSEVVGEMIRAAGLDGRGYVLAAKEEVELQIRWRRDRNWRAGSVPEGPNGFVKHGVGTIGGR